MFQGVLISDLVLESRDRGVALEGALVFGGRAAAAEPGSMGAHSATAEPYELWSDSQPRSPSTRHKLGVVRAQLLETQKLQLCQFGGNKYRLHLRSTEST